MPIVVGTYSVATPQMIAATEEALERELLRRAISQGAVSSAAGAVVRDLLPSDLADADDVESTACSTGWGLIDSGTLTDKKLIGIFGISNLLFPASICMSSGNTYNTSIASAYSGLMIDLVAPIGTAGVRFKLGSGGAKVKDIWNLQGKGIEQGKIVLGKAPVIYNKSELFNIDAISNASCSGSVAMIHGKVVEPRGEKVSPD